MGDAPAPPNWRRPAVTPLRALVFSVMWLVVGVLVRLRFRVVGCSEYEGGWLLMGYLLLSGVVVLWVNISQADFGEYDRTYRLMSRLAALAVLCIAVTACVPYHRVAQGCFPD